MDKPKLQLDLGSVLANNNGSTFALENKNLSPRDRFTGVITRLSPRRSPKAPPTSGTNLNRPQYTSPPNGVGRENLIYRSKSAENVQGQKISFANDPEKARKFLLDDRLKLVSQLKKHVDPSKYGLISKSLVTIFVFNMKGKQLVEWAIKTEASELDDFSTVLREDSLTNQIITQYIRRIGDTYLCDIIRDEVKKVVKSSPGDKEAVKKNEKKYQKIAGSILKSLCNSTRSCPSQLAYVWFLLNKEIGLRFPNNKNMIGIVASLFMLKFVTPAICSIPFEHPEFLNENSPPPRGSATALTAIARILQSVANGIGEEDVPSDKSNKFTKAKAPLLKEYIITLTTEDVPGTARHKTPEAALVTQKEEIEAIVCIQSFIVDVISKHRTKNTDTTNTTTTTNNTNNTQL